MDDIRLRSLESLARDFRIAIERSRPHLTSHSLQEFPRGACGDVSDMFGVFLQKKGFANVTYVAGERGSNKDGDWTTHAWLEVDGITVDISADQFSDAPNSIIVERESEWHDSFERIKQRSPGSCPPLEEFKIALDEDYDTIVNQLSFTH